MFYEDLGEFEKSYQLSLIAAYLSPQDADEWLRLAEVNELAVILTRFNFTSTVYINYFLRSTEGHLSCTRLYIRFVD